MTLTKTANPPPTPPGLLSAPMNWSASHLNVLSHHAPGAPIEPDPNTLNRPSSSGGSS